MPIIVAVLAWLTGGSDRLTVTRWAGLLAGLAGVALLAGRGAGWPIMEVLLVAVCYAIGPLIASRKAERAPARHPHHGAPSSGRLGDSLPCCPERSRTAAAAPANQPR